MKKIIVIWLAVCTLLCILPAYASGETENASITNGCNTVDGQKPFIPSDQLDAAIRENAKSLVLYDANTDTLLYASNPDIRMQPASLLKILTALIAIEKGNLDDLVTVRQELLSVINYDVVVVEPPLKDGETLCVRDLLYCMMVASGNDAAIVLADHVMGSQAAFVAEMNRYASDLGCTNTNFTNVHGLHDDAQYTTARDMARILAKASENDQFCEIFNAKKYTVPANNITKNPRYLTTQNFLLSNEKDINYYDERVSGSRTAVANDRTRSIASIASGNGMRLVAVVMGAQSVYEEDGYTIKVYGGYKETTELFNLGLTGYKAVQLLGENEVYKQFPVSGGSSDVTVGVKNAAYAVIPETISKRQLEFRILNETHLSAPVEKDQHISTLQIWYNGNCLAQEDLYAMSTVLPTDQVFIPVETLGNSTDNKMSADSHSGLWLLGIGILILFAVILLIAKRRKKKRRSRSRRRR